MSPSRRILLVEDDDTDVLFLRRAFQKVGIEHPIDVVVNGRDAISHLAGRDAHPAPTHVLLDLKLPEKSGVEVLRWIRDQDPPGDLHVAILTSSREAADLRDALDLRAECYFVKPMSFTALLDVARSIERWVRAGEVPALVQAGSTRRA